MRQKRFPSTPKASYLIKEKGFSLIELLLASALFSIVVAAFFTAFAYGQEGTLVAGNRNRATLLAEEGLEAIRNIRDSGFANLNPGTYGLSATSGKWEFLGTNDATNKYTRSIVISDVDENTKRISSNVSWQQTLQRAGNLNLVTYLADWQKAVLPGWDDTLQSFAGLEFPGIGDGPDVYTDGNYAYFIRYHGNPGIVIIDITDPSNPIEMGSRNLNGSPTGMAINGDYAYATTTNNTRELEIIDMTDKNNFPTASVFDAPGHADANKVAYKNGVTYFTRMVSTDKELYAIDVSDPLNPKELGSIDLEDSPYEIRIAGNYAYLSSYDNGKEFQIIDIGNPKAMKRISYLNINNGNDTADGISLEVFGNNAVLGRTDGMVYFIDITNPLAPALLTPNGFNIEGGIPNDIASFNDGKYISVATTNATSEVVVVDVSDISKPKIINKLDVGVGGNYSPSGIIYSKAKDCILLAGDRVDENNRWQFTIVKPIE